MNHAILARLFRRELAGARIELDSPAPQTQLLDRRAWFTIAVLGGDVAAYLLGADLAWTAVGGFTALMVVLRADPRASGGASTGRSSCSSEGCSSSSRGWWCPARPASRSGIFRSGPDAGGVGSYLRTAGIFLIGSNLVSNVPFILVVKTEMARMPNPRLGWELLAMASTFAGNLTLLGSVANIIVAERGREVGGLAFVPYLRVGVPLALATTAIGTAWLLFVFG